MYVVFVTSHNPITCSELEVLNLVEEILKQRGKWHVSYLWMDWNRVILKNTNKSIPPESGAMGQRSVLEFIIRLRAWPTADFR
jgi:hypothetical protein